MKDELIFHTPPPMNHELKPGRWSSHCNHVSFVRRANLDADRQQRQDHGQIEVHCPVLRIGKGAANQEKENKVNCEGSGN